MMVSPLQTDTPKHISCPFLTSAVAIRMQYKLRQEADDIVYTVLARGDDAPPDGDAAVLRDYFNLETSLVPLAETWAAADERFREVAPHIPGKSEGHGHQRNRRICPAPYLEHRPGIV